MPGLYDPSVTSLVRESLQHVWSVKLTTRTGTVIPLEVTECEITMDESWRPYVQGRLTGVVPPDQATLDLLDPRQHVKAEISAGYVLPGGITNTKPLATLYLSGRTVRRPDNLIELALQGQEYLFARSVSVAGPDAFNPVVSLADAIGTRSSGSVRDAIAWILYTIGNALFGYGVAGEGWDYAGASDLTGWSGDLRYVDPNWIDERYGAGTPYPGAVLLGVAYDIAGLTGCWLRCDETGTWRCTGPMEPAPVTAQWIPKGTIPTPPSLALAVGSGGTVITSDTSFDRDTEWANYVAFRFSWAADTTGKGRWGFARVTSGPFSVATIGTVAVTLDEAKPYYVDQRTADARAFYALRRTLARGRMIRLDAVAAYWLRPTDVITIQLPLGPQERHYVGAVTYRLHEGLMSVTTSLPDTTSQITLGGA